MNYSKPMKINFKRFITFWVVTLVIAALIGSGITALLMQPKKVEAETNFFTKEVQQLEPIGEYRITGYCPCKKCCGIWAKNRPNGIVYGSGGVELTPGVSIAAPFPIGTKLYIEGLGEYVVQDKVADWVLKKYDNKVIDIYCQTHEEAQKVSESYRNVFIVKGESEND